VKNPAIAGSGWGALPDFRRFVRRVSGESDAPEPVSAWRIAPEAALAALAANEKRAFIAALLPLVRSRPTIERRNMRRIYQLFAFMEMPAAVRLELLDELENQPMAAPEVVPFFRDRGVRRSLVEEAELFARNASSRAASNYAALLRVRLNVKSGNSRKLTRLLEKLTDIENRAAALLGKHGHIVRLDDRGLETFKKGVAAVGVPAAVLFPLGTVGLSAEGITTGLIALGGGFILPAGLAMVTGLGVAVAIGITTKKLLDMLMPTIDADRVSIDVQQLRNGVVEAQCLLYVVADNLDYALRERARERIERIMQRIAPLTSAQRTRIECALEHERALSARYFASLQYDRAQLEQRHRRMAHELERLLDVHLQATT